MAVLSSAACAGGMGGGQLADQWSGFYLGGNLGGIWGHFQGPITAAPFTDDVATYPASPMPFNANKGGLMGGGQVGYHRLVNQMVIGTEINFDGIGLSNSHTLSASDVNNTAYNAGGTYVAGDVFNNTSHWQAAWVGHLGWTVDNWLLYALGGVTFTQEKIATNIQSSTYENVIYPGSSGSNSSVLIGGTVGAGTEYSLTQHLHLGVEYRYADYGSHQYGVGQISASQSNAGTFIFTPMMANMALSTNQVLARLNYRF